MILCTVLVLYDLMIVDCYLIVVIELTGIDIIYLRNTTTLTNERMIEALYSRFVRFGYVSFSTFFGTK